VTAKPHSIGQIALHRLRTAVHTLRGITEREAPAKWVIEEAHVARTMRPQLQPEIALANDIETFAFSTISSLTSLRQPQDILRAHATLVTRALHDLRVCMISCLSGYTMQGWTVAASAFEAAHMAGFIGEDTARAAKWLGHLDIEKPVIGVKDAVVGTFKYLEIVADASARQQLVDNEYELYTYLCMAKHVNPIPERHRYWVEDSSGTRLLFTPFYTPGRVREARLGLGLANRSALLAGWVLARAHATPFHELEPELLALANRTAQAVRDWKASADGD
jgi:hypothetical protein